jgi:ParB/RepB/Spo0J family partition protein
MSKAKKVSKIAKIAKVAVVNNEVINSEVNAIVANEIVNTEVPEVVIDSDIPESDIVNSEIENDDDSEVTADFTTQPTEELGNYEIVSLDDIIIVVEENRKSGMDDKSITEFAAVLRRDKGVRTPIQVFFDDQISKYRLISGHRRYLASKKAGYNKIPAMIFSAKKAEEVFDMRLGENLDRVDLSIIDIAEQMNHALVQFGWTRKKIAERFSTKSYRKYLGSDVTKIISLLQLPELQKQFLIDGTMHVNSAYKYLKLNNKNPIAANNAKDALEALEDHIKNMSQSRARKLADIVISKASGDEPEAEEVLNSGVETPESTDSVINDSVINDSEVTENRIDPSLRLTPNDCFPESEEEPTPISSRRSSPNDITPPTTKSDSENESNSEVERLLAEARKSERNKEMSFEAVKAMLQEIEAGVQGYPISGFFEDLFSAMAGHDESIPEMISLLKDLVLAPKKGANKNK